MANTPIPSKVIEYSSTGTSGVREYKLTPEELEEVRQKYPATKRDKTFKAPIQIKTQTKEEKEMAKFKMTAEEYFAQRAAGKTIAQIAKEQGVSEATIYNHMDKWAKEGKGVESPKETQLLREKAVLPPQPPVPLPEMYKKAQQEIEQLKAALTATQPVSHDMLKEYKATGERLAVENAELKDEVEHWKDQATEAVALAGKAAEESMTKVELSEARADGAVAAREAAELELDQTSTARDEYKRLYEEQFAFAQAYYNQIEALKAANGRFDELLRERDDSLAELKAWSVLKEPQPASEVHLLDRSIAELSRARWILDRLSASGE
ncbi:helix-turn-helix domain-containing protein [Paenibacillus donghaensis]|uniref:Uncharacterized protein n=1 Tax=Paenibacillus donghaensis TaxID=414771 RepID=A0A2Z2KPY2_9BACL|nr:helix-turn-helix domain-containing protein [Paenibacillus donghaensis]ASA22331.1 hypothetical protein B9T62_16985 [Paenibacillus donghaensis]